MEIMNCSEIKESLVRHLSEGIDFSKVMDQCVFTLPLRSLDDRSVEVFVEKKLGEFYRVHDAGITSSHLFAQGIHITEKKSLLFEEVARRLGVTYLEGRFETSCQMAELQNAILAVSQCSALASLEVAAHKPVFEDEPIITRVQRSLKAWQPPYVKQINSRFPVNGRKATHIYEFVSFPYEPDFNTVAVKILQPSHSPQAQSERYGFLVLDTESTLYGNWRRLAIVTKAETWGDKPLRLVHGLSHETIDLVTGEEAQVEQLVPRIMDVLSKAA
jgi:hypothetical protein